MKIGVPKPLALAVALACSAQSQAQTWLEHNQPFEFKVPQADAATPLYFFINNTDVTELVSAMGEGRFRYNSTLVPLPSGEIELVVYSGLQGNWQQIHSEPMNVLTPKGFERANLAVSGSVSVDSQWDADATGDIAPPEEEQFHNGNLQLAFASEHERGNFNLETGANVVGVSKQENALRYGEDGERAPKVDLSDYIVSAKKGRLKLALGHITYGNNPLLLNGLSNRGVNGGYKIMPWLDIGFTQQSGSALAGWDNFLGVANSKHRISAGSIGVELPTSMPGRLRIEYTWVNGQTESKSDFGAGQVTDVEKQSGWGITLDTGWFDERLTATVAWAKSRFSNPLDEALLSNEFGETPVEVRETSDTAWQFQVAYELLRDSSPERPFSATLSWQKQRADAQYRALAAFPSADNLSEQFRARGRLYAANWQLQHGTSEDNVDNIANLLKTRTRDNQASVELDLKQLFTTSHAALPKANVRLQQMHQYALNKPNSDDSDFNGDSHLPDQMNDLLDLSLDWSLGNFSLGYAWSQSKQDNRQPGREEADFDRLNHALNGSANLFDSVSLNLSIGRAKNLDKEQQTEFYNRNGSLTVVWQMGSDWSLDTGYSLNRDFTSLGSSESQSTAVHLGLSQNWTLGGISGQWNLRYAEQRNRSLDTTFDFDSRAENWAITSGLSIQF